MIAIYIYICVKYLIENKGKIDYKELDRFITRDEFKKIRYDTSPINCLRKYIYSFSNNGINYLYRPEIEKIFINKEKDINHYERHIKRTNQIKKFENIDKLLKNNIFITSNKHYKQIDLSRYNDEETIIYCDPPYRGTRSVYSKNKFDYNEFDKWLAQNDKTIFLSEYNAPFTEILKINKTNLASRLGAIKSTEKLYINKNYKGYLNTTIFDFL